MKIKKNLLKNMLYTKSHEWVLKKNINDDFCFIGISNYAQEQMGDIAFIEIFDKKKKFKRNNILGEIESVKSVNNVIAPFEGNILEVNENVIESPDLINNDPYNRGWIIKYKIKNISDLEKLLNYKEYLKYIKSLN